jgi:hypothetical protein
MAYIKRKFSYTATGAATGSDEVGLGAVWGRIHQLVIDDNASVEAAVEFTITDDRGVAVFAADPVDISEGPFYKNIGSTVGDATDDNPAVVAGVIAKGPVTISHAAGANADVYTGYIVVEI